MRNLKSLGTAALSRDNQQGQQNCSSKHRVTAEEVRIISSELFIFTFMETCMQTLFGLIKSHEFKIHSSYLLYLIIDDTFRVLIFLTTTVNIQH